MFVGERKSSSLRLEVGIYHNFLGRKSSKRVNQRSGANVTRLRQAVMIFPEISPKVGSLSASSNLFLAAQSRGRRSLTLVYVSSRPWLATVSCFRQHALDTSRRVHSSSLTFHCSSLPMSTMIFFAHCPVSRESRLMQNDFGSPSSASFLKHNR